jgi:hypothetical protein
MLGTTLRVSKGRRVLLSDIVDLADVRVHECRDRLGFDLEAPAKVLAILESVCDRLDGDRAAQPRIGGAIDLAHPARADERVDFIRAEARAVCQGHVGFRTTGGGRIICRRSPIGGGCASGSNQRSDCGRDACGQSHGSFGLVTLGPELDVVPGLNCEGSPLAT